MGIEWMYKDDIPSGVCNVKRVLLLVLILTACGVEEQPMMISPLTSPVVSPLHTYFPTLGKSTPAQVLKGVGRHKYYPLDCQELRNVGVMWMYDWSLTPEVCMGIESVPMIYSKSGVGKPLGGNSPWVLGFNEPDYFTQSNVTPQQAVSLWAQIEEDNPYKLLIAPAPAGDLTWLRTFYNTYQVTYGRAPRIDALAVHFYSSAAVPDASRALRQKLRSYRAQADEWGIKYLWLTEFAHLTQGAEFLQEVLPWLPDECDRFAWFQWEYLGTETWAFGVNNNTSLWLNGQTDIAEVYKENR